MIPNLSCWYELCYMKKINNRLRWPAAPFFWGSGVPLINGGVEEGNGKPPQHMYIPLNNMAEDLIIDKTDGVNEILLKNRKDVAGPAGVKEKAEMISVRLLRSSSNEILSKRKTSQRLEHGMCGKCGKRNKQKRHQHTRLVRDKICQGKRFCM